MVSPIDTTQSERLLRKVKPRRPGFRLLFSAESIIPEAPWYPLEPGEHWIGRKIGNQPGLCLDKDSRASRLHAVVRSSATATPIEIRDADSKSGLFINGFCRQQAALCDGDVVRIGQSLLLFRYEQADCADAPVSSLLGISAPQRSLRSRVRAIARDDSVVLILGESGTGKDLTARALHAESGRSGPMICVNCGAIPDSLAESQLFGHVAGCFTGAQKDRQGFFTAAQRGTLFLDEIGELSARGQALLLRALEDRMVTPVGATVPTACDVRIIAATNRELPRAVETGQFRGDLYARLAATVLKLVPLRSRHEDILLLMAHALGPRSLCMTARLAEALLLYPFPFNVRELNQIAKDLMASGEDLLDLPLVAERLTAPLQVGGLVKQAESPQAVSKQPLSREVLLRLLSEHHGVIARVAKAAGRSRRQVMRWLEQYQLDSQQYKG